MVTFSRTYSDVFKDLQWRIAYNSISWISSYKTSLQVLKTSLQVLKNVTIGLQKFFFFLTRLLETRFSKEGHFPIQFGKKGKTLINFFKKGKSQFCPEDLLAKLFPCWTFCNHIRVHSILLMHALSQLYAMHSSPFQVTSSAATFKGLHKQMSNTTVFVLFFLSYNATIFS